jgi:hypothetical protein
MGSEVWVGLRDVCNMKQIALRLLISGLCIVLMPSFARADCAPGPDYSASVGTDSISVCPSGGGRDCGSDIGLLRQNVADGAVVVIGNNCGNGCYTDYCVPPGTYRYGYATPFDCSQAGCYGRVALFVEATMHVWVSQTCTGTNNTSAPIATSVTPPWGTSSADAGIDRFKTCSSGGGGCATVTNDRRTVRIIDALALGFGILLMGLRAHRRRSKSA